MKHLQIHIDKYEVQSKEILKSIHFTLNHMDRIAIVGQNGAGKTTLMKILTGEIQDFQGSIDNIGNLSFGYLAQIYSDNEEKTVFEELKDAFFQVLEMEENLKNYEEKMASGNMEILDEYSSLLEQFNNIGGYDYEKEIHAVANGIGILDLLEKKLVEVSGGQRTKVALAKVLLVKPDILLLDEPTNFIDLSSVEWLENYLNTKWFGGFVIISHDREFLDKTCDKTYELQITRPINFYHVPYSQYVIEREKKEKKLLEDYERQQEWIKDQTGLVNRFRAGSRAGWAKSREKMIERLDKIETPYIPQKPKFQFLYGEDSGDKILNFKGVFIGRKDPLFFINELTLYKGQKVGIVGENGVGKSTLLKSIIGQLEILDGYFRKASSLQVGYYSQMHEELDKKKTIKQNFEKHGFFYADQVLSAILAHYLFSYDDIHKKVGELSGGQITRLHFAILGQKETNFLILDEPTNHLDYDSREALEFALKKYEGTILFISHDRYFVNKMASHIWFIRESELSLSYGNYEDYKFKLENGINMDMSLFNEEAQLNLVLEEKLGEKNFKRLQERFGGKKKRK
ncbi:ABC-F family ATP-binding cassette domain-containing protein [Candidatus Gracilibacteria bacterium]|nr:ABC-F family ATP-binding cassette domain-containing protein [Candidatus Gracilibacteria bacterium]NUJ99372.1 ABC-F family ATP-binding cassette domain-containing protein [Candidatus Gracilibacteria bacterium]